MSPHWTERVVALHPIFVTGIFVALFAGAALLIPSALDRATYGSLPLLACLALWNFCLHRVAIHKITARTGTHAQTPRIIFVLIACQVTFTAVLLAMRYIANEQLLGLAETLLLVSLMGAGISYFGLMFSAAAALMKFEEGARPVPNSQDDRDGPAPRVSAVRDMASARPDRRHASQTPRDDHRPLI